MIVENGTIQILKKIGVGFDENGNPIKPTEEPGEPIPCNWKRNTYEKRGVYEDGVFTAASYIILIEMQEFNPGRFRLSDSKGNVLGDYEARQKGIVYLDYVGCIEITV